MFAPFQVNKQTAISSRPSNRTTIFLSVLFLFFMFVYLSKTKDFIFCSHACVFAQNDNRKSKVNSNVFVLPMVSVLCVRQHKLIRDLRLLRFQAMIANPTPSPTYGFAFYVFPIFTSYVQSFPEWIPTNLLKSRWNKTPPRRKENSIHSN